MYLIKKVYYDSAENERYAQILGVINGDDAAALTWERKHQFELEPKYKGADGMTYPYFRKVAIPVLTN